ncbi:MAG: AbrB family transcriptional regulator [Smithella sp.]|jgi:membrane AbrB-like protein
MKQKIIWWMVLGALAAVLGYGVQLLAIPGGWFAAAMLVAVVAGLVRPSHPRITSPVLMGVQAVIGTMLGINIRPGVIPVLLFHLPAIIGVVAVTIGVSIAAGVVISRISSISRETATLGTMPGGAGAMIAISLGTEADTKIVALMQYLRLILVVMSAVLVASFLVHYTGHTGHTPGASLAIPAQSPVSSHSLIDIFLTFFMAVLGVWGGRLIRLPTANLLGPMLLGLGVSYFHLFHPVMPVWAPPLAYILMGFYVGLLFDRKSLIQARQLLPLLVANTLVLIIVCALTGFAFAGFSGASLLSGYLATSPGGGDSIAIIALGSGADLSLVFSVQIIRLLVIVFTGSFMTRAVLHITRKKGERQPPIDTD